MALTTKASMSTIKGMGKAYVFILMAISMMEVGMMIRELVGAS